MVKGIGLRGVGSRQDQRGEGFYSGGRGASQDPANGSFESVQVAEKEDESEPEKRGS
jgi:hypothetical protein